MRKHITNYYLPVTKSSSKSSCLKPKQEEKQFTTDENTSETKQRYFKPYPPYWKTTVTMVQTADSKICY